jgi:Bifunctional DNA primase/polymerase, N-terminal
VVDRVMSEEPESTVQWAMAYASRGWPVFPCQPGSKEPATRHGFHDATTDPDRIRSWWRRQPTANLAIVSGRPGPDVLDVDQHGEAGSGFAAFSRLRREGLLDAVSAIVATPGGGLHAYFTGSDQASGRLPRLHLDFRSQGGYVLAPPSQIDGRHYRLITQNAQSGGLDWAAVTTLLDPRRIRAIQPRTAARGDLSHLAAWVERLQEGNRNAGLYWAACRAVEAAQPAVLDDLAAAAAATGLTDREIARTISSARRGTQRPFEHQTEPEGSQ